MKKLLLSLAFALLLGSAAAIDYVNPILPYDYSDPDVCRVGDRYLLTSSSFNNIPGLQLLESTDLVHWTIVDAALPSSLPGYTPDAPLLGNFVWAPSIREHDGMLYIYYGDPDRGIYCVRADISGGLHYPLAWQEALLVMPGKGYIDPCPLWDEDGRVWLCHALAGSRAGLKSVLLMAELTADGLAVQTPSRIIFDGHAEHPTCEGPKLYKRNGYYYIMHPAGGVSTGWQVVQRSTNIYGPYELRITLSQGKTSVNGPHQGGWVSTPDGDWFLHFQDVGVAGRIVHMQPVRWVDDWPVMGADGLPVMRYGKPSKERPYAAMARRDEFTAPALALDWQWAGGRVDPRWFFLDSEHGLLRLFSFPRTDELIPNMLLQKIPAVAFTATARVRFCPNANPKLQGGEEAGMVVFGREVFTVGVDTDHSEGWTYLRLEMNDHQVGQFYTSADGKKWQKSGDSFQAVEGKWIGAQVGLYCTRTDTRINDSGWLDVDYFEITLK